MRFALTEVVTSMASLMAAAEPPRQIRLPSPPTWSRPDCADVPVDSTHIERAQVTRPAALRLSIFLSAQRLQSRPLKSQVNTCVTRNDHTLSIVFTGSLMRGAPRHGSHASTQIGIPVVTGRPYIKNFGIRKKKGG